MHSKPRHEKALSADLARLNVPHYLPLARVPRRYAGTRTFVELPLFPGYLFLRGHDDERVATLSTHRVVSIRSVVDQDLLESELIQLHRVTSSREPIDLYPGIRIGQKCRVIRGSLAGVEGVVIRRRGMCRVYLSVSLICQSAEMEIDPSLLEVCG